MSSTTTTARHLTCYHCDAEQADPWGILVPLDGSHAKITCRACSKPFTLLGLECPMCRADMLVTADHTTIPATPECACNPAPLS